MKKSGPGEVSLRVTAINAISGKVTRIPTSAIAKFRRRRAGGSGMANQEKVAVVGRSRRRVGAAKS
jgi:small-conductance mechanosensitive channel